MYPLIDTRANQLMFFAQQCGFPDMHGQLVTPLGHAAIHPLKKFAIDNGGYMRALPVKWRRTLERAFPHRENCLFVTLPDIVGDARRTLELFHLFRPEVVEMGYPIALVAQDGIENLEIPWRLFSAIFVGGTTEWKMGRHALNVIRAAQWQGKHVHVGRVNTGNRWEIFAREGADTFDGSGLVVNYPGAPRQRGEIKKRRESFLLTGKYTPAKELDLMEHMPVPVEDLEVPENELSEVPDADEMQTE